MPKLARCYNTDDLRLAAKQRLPKVLFDYIDGGSEDGVALRGNRDAFEQIMLETKFMVDLSGHDLSVDLFGKKAGLPMVIAPTGMAGLLWHNGEVELAKAAAKFEIPFAMSMMSINSMEDIVRAVDGRYWFQVYVWREMEYNFEMIRRARDLGFEALVITIDNALGRSREHNARNGLNLPFRPNLRAMRSFASRPRWFANVMLPYLARGQMPVHANLPEIYQKLVHFRAGQPAPKKHIAMTWADIARIRDMWPRKLIIKSVLTTEDARMAVEYGADGIVISNHGGRTLDSARPPISVLPEIAAAVGDRTTIMVDSGIRRGSDVAKSLALGAQAVMLGRATLFGVAAGGQAGAEKALEILRTEFEKTLGYIGCPRARELSRANVARARRPDYATAAGLAG